jgi:hypothetical protein
MREFSTTVALTLDEECKYHQDLAWTALMADVAVRDENGEFVKMEALKPVATNTVNTGNVLIATN